MVETISNMQLADLNLKLHGGTSLRDLIYHEICDRFYPIPGSGHNALLRHENSHGTTQNQTNTCDKAKKMKCIMRLYKYCAGKFYHVLFINHAGKNISRSKKYTQPDLT